MRRLLPRLLAAGLLSIILYSVFRSSAWQWSPQAVRVHEGDGTSVEDTKSSQEIHPEQGDGKSRNAFKELKVESTSPYPIGKTKPPGSNYTRSLVLARLKEENVSWIDERLYDMVNAGLLLPAVYLMDDPAAPLHAPANKGHEAMAYLTFIIDHYDNLADVNIFMHAHRWTWHNNELQYTDSATMVRELSPERVTREGYMNLRCHWEPGCPDHLHPGATTVDEDKLEEVVIADSWGQLFPDEPLPPVLAQACCAQFAVSRDRIRELPRERYARLREWALRTELSDYLAGRVFEYVWQVVFARAPVHCPSMSVCYCDGFGYCFGGPEEFDAWFETRYWSEQYQEELRIWKEKTAKAEEWRAAQEGGELSEGALMVMPEKGRDVWLQNKINELASKLVQDLQEAHERGQNPAQRAKEAGRPWKEGDGF